MNKPDQTTDFSKNQDTKENLGDTKIMRPKEAMIGDTITLKVKPEENKTRSAAKKRPADAGKRAARKTTSGKKSTKSTSGSTGTKSRKKGKKRKQKRKASIIPLIISAVAILIIIGVMAIVFEKSSGNGKQMNKATYFGMNNETEVPLIVNDKVIDPKAIVLNDRVYVGYNTTWSYLNSAFYLDEENHQMIMTLPSETRTWGVDDGSGDVVSDGKGNTYISIDCITANSDIDIAIYEEPKRVVARTNWSAPTGTMKEETQVRYRGGPKSEVLTTVAAGDKVVVTEDLEDWIGVSTQDGYIGYVKAETIERDETTALTHTPDEQYVFSKQMMDGKVCMAWLYTEMEGNIEAMQELTANAVGLNVLSPTWFKLDDENGTLYSLATPEFVSIAHQKGLKVWGLFGDIMPDCADAVTAMNTAEKRAYIVQQLLEAAAATGMDGINLDFEKIGEDGMKNYLQFIRELSIGAHACGLTVSVDNYVPAFTSYYQRAEQAKCVDYVVIMGYDEHTASSSEAGSVASLPFVEQGIVDTLKEVPASQVINGVPFYTRAWTQEFGSDTLTVESKSMNEADQFVQAHGITLAYDESVGQSTGTANDSTARYSIWMENEEALEGKLNLIKKYQLAGISAWRLGFERDSVWQLIQSYLTSY